jgi:hypothetical protein
MNLVIPAAFYVAAKDLVIHMSIFYNRGAFTWIPAESAVQLDNTAKKFFGDRPRSLNK